MQPPLSVVLSSSSVTCSRRLRLGFACTSHSSTHAKQIVRVIVIIIGALSLLSYLVNF